MMCLHVFKLYISENFDSSGNSYSYADFQRSILGICHSLVFCDEQFQVNGVNFLMDYGAVTLKHLSFGGIDNIKKRSIHFQVGKYSILNVLTKYILSHCILQNGTVRTIRLCKHVRNCCSW